MKVCEVRGIHLRAAEKNLLQDGCLDVSAGELVALLGPNGSGKSSFLRAVAGLCSMYDGSIRVADVSGRLQDLHRLSGRQRARSVAFVPQQNGACPLRVLDVVRLGRTPWQNFTGDLQPEDHAAVDMALCRAGVETLAPALFSTLSGGERQRVLLAKALAQQPRLLLLDEPTSALDHGGQLEVMALLAELALEGMGILMVCHDLNMAAMFAHTVALLHKERLETGTPHSLLTSERLSALYDCTLQVDENPWTHTPRITVVSDSSNFRQ